MTNPEHSQLKVNTRAWPLVFLTTVGSPTDGQLQSHLKEIEEKVLGRNQEFVQIIDQSRAESLNAGQRALIAEHQESMNDSYARYCRGEAYVSDTKMKGVMVAVFWQAKPPYPYRFFEDRRQAEAWAKSLISC